MSNTESFAFRAAGAAVFGLLAFMPLVAAPGCSPAPAADERAQADPILLKLGDRLSGILEQGRLPEIADVAPERMAALRDPRYGVTADYKAWLEHIRSYNHLLETELGYRNLPIVNQVTDNPLEAPWRFELWARRLVHAGGGSAFAQADFLMRSFPADAGTKDAAAEGAAPASATAAPAGNELEKLTQSLVTAARIVDTEALGQVSPRQRELLRFVVPWICRSGGRFCNKSKGSPQYVMHWSFNSCDPFAGGDKFTACSHTPIPPEFGSQADIANYLVALAGAAPEDKPAAAQTRPGRQFTCRVDWQAMRRACDVLAQALSDEALDRLKVYLSHLPPSVAGVAGVAGKLLKVIETPYGRIIIGGGANRYVDVDALAIIDIGGGNDYIYTHPEDSIGRRGVQVIVNFGGDNLYQTSGVGGPGAGILGIGIMIDRAGNNRYCQGLFPAFQPRHYSRATLVKPDPDGVRTNIVPLDLLYGDPSKPGEPGVALDAGFAFGAGFLGVGLCISEGGDNLYLGQKYALGVGFWRGVGVLQCRGGNNVYAAGLASLGAGINGAFGLLDDRAGDNHYQCLGTFESPYSAGQQWDNGYDSSGIGCGSSWRAEGGQAGRVPTLGGGVGLLHDGGPKSSYIGSLMSVASGYAGGLGAVIDDAGGNTYFVKRGPGGSNYSGWSGNHALGNGCHRGVGILLDRGGNNRYSGSNMGGGTAWDMGMGYLLDLGGDALMTDLYGKKLAGNTGWGAAKALAVSFHYGGRSTFERATFGDASAIGDASYSGVGGNFSFFFDVGSGPSAYPKPGWNNTIRLGGNAWIKRADGKEYPQGIGLFLDGPDVLTPK